MTVYAHLNSVSNGSTGGIMMERHREVLSAGEQSFVFWGRGRRAACACEMKFASNLEVYTDVIQTRLDGKAGFHSKSSTKRLLARLDEINPDVLYLHNIHGYYVNVEMLFNWIAAHRCRVEWTLHDCWSFTGHCSHFTYARCAQWKSHCAQDQLCPQLNAYPKTFSKGSCSWNYVQKRRVFTMLPVEQMTLVTPSRWLAQLVEESFLSKYPVVVRHNTVNSEVFKSTPSDFRERYDIGDRFMILGVASPWTDRKGLDDFKRLAREVDFDAVAIVLVGLSERQIQSMPEGIIALGRTESREELAGIYSSADLFFNPTIEDNYPTVNLEAEACGTPVLTYDTGGCAETVHRADSRVVGGYDTAVLELRERLVL